MEYADLTELRAGADEGGMVAPETEVRLFWEAFHRVYISEFKNDRVRCSFRIQDLCVTSEIRRKGFSHRVLTPDSPLTTLLLDNFAQMITLTDGYHSYHLGI